MHSYPISFSDLQVTKREPNGVHHFAITIAGRRCVGHSLVEDIPNKTFFMAHIALPDRVQAVTIICNIYTRSGIAI